jgi:two-component system copper resistance phosphate regulon response regulator CusR
MRVLVVEDELKIAEALRDGLEAEQYSVSIERSGEAAFFRASTDAFDLILMDLGLPGRDGLEIISALRRNTIRTPIIVLTARDAVDARVAGLDAGADDYLIKPFAFEELVARVRALIRREPPPLRLVLTAGALSLDVVTRTVTRDGEPLDLTVKEFEVIECLMRFSGQIVSRETLAREVWKEVRSTSLDNVIDVHITRLRRKVDAERLPSFIHTVRGVGFTLELLS